MVKNHKDGNEMKAAPFYLVYKGVSAKKLILNGRTMIKIHLVPNDENIAFLFPKKFKAEVGYELFKKTASLVMPLIKLGKHGSQIKLPECNRILGQKTIKGLYKRIRIFRHGVKMPTSKPQLKDRRNRLLFRIHGKSQAITIQKKTDLNSDITKLLD
jgi:hypothetical protein